MDFNLIVTLIPAIPLLAALVNGLALLFGDKLHYRNVQNITLWAVFASFVGALWVFAQVLQDPAPREVMLYRWFTSDDLSVDVAFLVDSLSAIMMVIVTGFSFMIGKFSVNYMHRDYSFTRYFTAFALFVFAMLMLVMGNNFVLLFLGWESVGVCSYLLIGHYYNRASAARAGTKAFVMNRVGDAGFLMGIFIIATHFGSVNYSVVLAQAPGMDSGIATAIGLCLLLGAIGKSAQLPLGTWLSKAMEGPTPSSALIHAATMVTAGIYMIVRSHAIYDMAPNALLVVGIVGALTAFYGGMVGLVITDIKGVLAFSTTTQLGLMFLACGLGAYAVAIYHLVAHAFLKSFLFMTAPSILHHLHGHADWKAREAESSLSPVYRLVLVASVGLVLIPFLAGWWQNDIALGGGRFQTFVLMGTAAIAVFAVIYASKKMMGYAFAEHHGGGHGDEGHGHEHAHHSPQHADEHVPAGSSMMYPMLVLAAMALVGVVFGILPGGIDNTWFKAFMAPVVTVQANQPGGSPVLAYILLAAIVLLLLGAWFTTLYLERFKPELPGLAMLRLRWVYALLSNRFYLDELYDKYLVGGAKKLGSLLDRFDTRVIDRIVGAPTEAPRVSTALTTWEQRFLGLRGMTAQQETESPLARSLDKTEAQAEKEGGEHPSGMVGAVMEYAAEDVAWVEKNVVSQASGVAGWLTGVSSRATGWAEKEVIGRASGVAGVITEFAATDVSWVEKNVVGRASGVAGWATEWAAFDSAWIERHIIGRASGLVGNLTEVLGAISAWVEHHIFGEGVNVGIPLAGGLFGHAMVRIEEFISKPLVAGVVLVGVLLLGLLS